MPRIANVNNYKGNLKDPASKERRRRAFNYGLTDLGRKSRTPGNPHCCPGCRRPLIGGGIFCDPCLGTSPAS